MLATIFCNNNVYLTDIAEATSFGAALSAKIAMNNNMQDITNNININYKLINAIKDLEYKEYKSEWLRRCK